MIPAVCLLLLALCTMPSIDGHFIAPRDTELRALLPLPPATICEGKISGRVEHFSDYARVRINVWRCLADDHVTMIPRTGTVVLSATQFAAHVQPGALVRFQSGLHRLAQYWNAGTTTVGIALRSEGVVASGHLRDPSLLVVLTPARNFSALISHWRTQIESALAGDGRQPTAVAALRAMLLGDGELLDDAQWQSFRRVGVIHLLVVSGLNVSVIVVALYGVVAWAWRRNAWCCLRVPYWYVAAGSALVGVWSYVALVGGAIPIVRAAIVATFWLAAQLIGRRSERWSGVAGALLIILLWQPLAYRVPSLQLTFAAVVAMLLWGPWLMGAPSRLPWWHWRSLCVRARQFFALSLAVTIGVTPIVAWHFHETSLMGLVANIFFVPWVSGVMVPLGFFFMTLGVWWHALSHVLVQLLIWNSAALLHLVAWADQWSGAWQWHWTPRVSEIILWYAMWGGVRWYFFKGKLSAPLTQPSPQWERDVHRLPHQWARVLAAGYVALTLFVGWQRFNDTRPGPLQITVADVGQGLAVVAQFPNRAVYVIDGGGIAQSPFDMGRFVMAPLLYHAQITHVDRLIMTHFHPDHYPGLAYLAEHFGVHALFTNGSAAAEHDITWPAIGARFTAAGVHAQVMDVSTHAWTEGGVTIRVLHPVPPVMDNNDAENDRSIVLELTYGARKILLTGDIERAAESRLVRSGELHPVDVVVAPHHGSNTSSTPEFVNALQPHTAIISCGRDNRYRFPRPEPLQAYANVHAHVYRTDQHGAVRITTDGDGLTVTSFVGDSKGD